MVLSHRLSKVSEVSAQLEFISYKSTISRNSETANGSHRAYLRMKHIGTQNNATEHASQTIKLR